MDHIKGSVPEATRTGISTQARRVADSVMHETGHEVYRRRLLGGTAACQVRTAVREAVTESLRNPTQTHADAANAGALAADHALAQVGIEVEKIGFQRMGWRGRLAHVLVAIESGNAATAAVELRGIIDGIHEEK